MSRRDIIIVTLLVNAGLLALVFMLAVNSDEDKIADSIDVTQIIQSPKPAEGSLDPTSTAPTALAASTETPIDEIDLTLKEYVANENSQPNLILEESLAEEQDEDPIKDIAPTPPPPETPKPTKPEPVTAKKIEITVKRGDSLDKIARANNSTVKAIKAANKMKSDKLDIGQVLIVPVGAKKKSATTATASSTPAKAKESKNIAQASTNSEGSSQYYTIKQGDNPWKIAKQFNIKVDQFLKINNLDEDKARNLKVGDKVKIK